MAASLNKVFLMGNLTRDPDLRSLPSGAAVCEFGMAMNRRFTTSSGQETDETCFVDIVVWGKSAENCRQYLEKGSSVMVEGRLQLDQWEDRNGGGKRSRLRVVAEQVQFISRRSDGQAQGGDNAGQGQYRGDRGGNPYQPPRPQQMPRQQSFGSAPNAMPRAPQSQPMPPLPDPGAAGPGGAEDDIPF
ncbi:MAG: single-stranded DNA-binding protein [Victivallaceae bacterium]|nr:single-stranded DNA-binding protein [Victivallaceae bacterium]